MTYATTGINTFISTCSTAPQVRLKMNEKKTRGLIFWGEKVDFLQLSNFAIVGYGHFPTRNGLKLRKLSTFTILRINNSLRLFILRLVSINVCHPLILFFKIQSLLDLFYLQPTNKDGRNQINNFTAVLSIFTFHSLLILVITAMYNY